MLDVDVIVLHVAPPLNIFARLLADMLCGTDGGGMLSFGAGEGTDGLLGGRGTFVGVAEGITRDDSEFLRDEEDGG